MRRALQLDAAGGRLVPQHYDASMKERRHPDALFPQLKLSRFNNSDVKDVVNNAEEVGSGAMNVGCIGGVPVDFLAEKFVANDFREPQDRIQRRSQLVAHIRQEKGLRLIRLLGAALFLD